MDYSHSLHVLKTKNQALLFSLNRKESKGSSPTLCCLQILPPPPDFHRNRDRPFGAPWLKRCNKRQSNKTEDCLRHTSGACGARDAPSSAGDCLFLHRVTMRSKLDLMFLLLLTSRLKEGLASWSQEDLCFLAKKNIIYGHPPASIATSTAHYQTPADNLPAHP